MSDKGVGAYTLIEVMAQACAEQNAEWEVIAQRMTAAGLDPMDAVQIAEANLSDVLTVNRNAGGGCNVWYYPAEQIQKVDDFWAGLSGNSNTMTIDRATVSVPVNTSVSGGGGGGGSGTVTFSTAPKGGGMGVPNAQYLLASVGQAVGAVSAGIALGKTIDSVLYNANPDFWDSHGMSSINPETWNSITNGDDSLAAGLFNMIFGLDPATGNAQAYMDKDALALFAMYMAQEGVFANGDESVVDYTETGGVTKENYPVPIPISGSTSSQFLYNNQVWYITVTDNTAPTYIIYYRGSVSNNDVFVVSSAPFKVSMNPVQGAYPTTINRPMYFNGVNVYYFNFGSPIVTSGGPVYTANIASPTPFIIGWIVLTGDVEQSTAIEGFDNQDGATLPNTSGWDTIPNTLSSLANQYPSMFSNPLTYDVLQPDGTVTEKQYIPVPFPNFDFNNESQPTSDTSLSSQLSPGLDNTTDTNTLIQILTQLLQQPQTDPQTQSGTEVDTTPQNPIDTGTGDTTSPILPVGSASALWSVYNPTQGQVDSFGAWLWSSPFETNIGKLFQNPIDGVITLHKVFATPDTGSAANIVVGTLDSGVSSATVPNQYTTVDCGSVDLYEDFANVFDYPPYTNVSLYLPFIGIVPLDTNDVMRSTISVTYGVDVYTGACLAMVEVSRDGNTVNMYQYAGMCSVEYPITNVQHSQFISGVLAVASGVASVATAGIGAPAALAIAGGAATAAKANVGRSGSFSGNSGAMGIKNPYLIIQRPQTKVADAFPYLAGYPTNVSGKLHNFGGHVVVTDVHVDGMSATDTELSMIEQLLHEGVLV